jgi:surfeit locus 1 family protein
MTAAARRLVVLVAAALGVLVTARLGVWQLARAAQKQELQAKLDSRVRAPALDGARLARSADDAETQHYRRVELVGRWDDGHTVFLDNRQMNGRPGFFVVTPLRLGEGRDAVLVQRGWAPRDMTDRTHVPALPPGGEHVELLGLIAPPPARLYALGAEGAGVIRQNLDLEAFARETGLSLRPLSVQQLDGPGSAADGLQRQWPPPAVDVHKNYGYAFQWFALAALITGLYVWFQLIRPRLHHSA